jgi:DNA ligase-associated metallophosphoesterase
MQGYAFQLHETPAVALPEAALFLPRTQTLVVSDLHFEKGSAFAVKGVMLPPFDTAETLRRLEALFERLSPRIFVALGDSFHDRDAGGRLAREDRAKLEALVGEAETIWIEGNHDPAPPAWLAGQREAAWHHDGLWFRHEPTGQVQGEVAGHLHPCARVTGKRGGTIRRRCFVTDGHKLIMPAFGAFTGGLNLFDPAFDGLFQGPVHALIPGGEGGTAKVHAIAAKNLTRSHEGGR